MTHFRRITALFTGFLFLHLAVGGAGLLHAMASCQVQEASVQGVETAASVMQMNMSQSHPSDPGDVQAPTSGTDECDESSSDADCPTAVPCSVPTVCSGATASLVPSYTSASVARLSLPVPPFRTTPPDLPPPRA